MPVLSDPKTIAGPLTAADLAETRKHSNGRLLPAGCDQQGRFVTRRHPGMTYEPWRDTVPTDGGDACAAEGGAHAEPKPALMPRRSWLCAAWLRLRRALT